METVLPELGGAVLLVNAGLHDIKRNTIGTGVSRSCQVGSEAYRANLEATVRTSRSYGARPIWISSRPVVDHIHNLPSREPRRLGFVRYGADLDEYNRIAEGVMDRMSVPIIHLHAATLQLIEERSPEICFVDHVHYQPAVRETQGTFIADQLKALLGNPPLRR